MQTPRPLTAFRRSPVIVLVGASERSRPALALLRGALIRLLEAPAPALALFAAGLGLALAWGGYIVAGLALLPALGLALAIRGAAHGGGWHTPAPAQPLTRMDRAVNVIGVLSAAGLVILGLVAMLWR